MNQINNRRDDIFDSSYYSCEPEFASKITYQKSRKDHWDTLASRMLRNNRFEASYHQRIAEIYQSLIPENSRVLELGCGKGDLLGILKPRNGVGVDFSEKMILAAKDRHPNLTFVLADAHTFKTSEPFDYVILSDLINDLWDVQEVFNCLNTTTKNNTKLIFNFFSHLWEKPLILASNFQLAKPFLRQNWLTIKDVDNLLKLSGFSTIKYWQEILFPINIWPFNLLLNKILVKLFPFNLFALTNFLIASPQPIENNGAAEKSVSIIIPARNEEGHIQNLINRIPNFGRSVEVIFIEGHSNDKTYEQIENSIKKTPGRSLQLWRQEGKGKADAVRMGFEKASGDILMILDADISVPPEALPKFYQIIINQSAEFVNGVRLVYPMEKEAMRFFNLLGNRFFSMIFSWIIGQPIKDTLCGTKVLLKKDYRKISENRSYFGDFDPFGDFDLLFGAAKLNLKIVDLPVRYCERKYGETNINRWSHGFLLLKMACIGALRLKFI